MKSYDIALQSYSTILRDDMVDCHPEETLSTEAEASDLPCHPVKIVIFILLYRMSAFPAQLQYYVIKLLYAPGDIFIECHPLL